MSRKLYTTIEVAKAAGVPRATLQYWIKTGRISAPKLRLIGGNAVRQWTGTQMALVRKLKGTLKPGPRKKRKKA